MRENNYNVDEDLTYITKEIVKDIFGLSFGVLFIGVGVYGAIQFGQELIDFCSSGQELTLATKLAADWKEAKVGLSAIIPVIGGGSNSYHAVKDLRENLQYRKILKNRKK